MSSAYLSTLGAFALYVDERRIPNLPTQKSRALLAYLVLHHPADAARERLMELFWPDVEPERAREGLRTALSSIRRVLRDAGVSAEAFLFANKSVARWIGATTSDIGEFLKLAASNIIEDQRDALARYTGEFLEGDYEDWTVTERERIEAKLEETLSRVAREAHDPEAARALIGRDPYDENAYAALIEADLEAGRHAAAAALADRCRTALAEAGSKPTPDFEARYGSLQIPRRQPPSDVQLPFVGRESELAALGAMFADCTAGRERIALVHGEPGIGKSTLLDRAAGAAEKCNLRVLTARAVEDDSRPFGPWQKLFEALTHDNIRDFIKRGDGNAGARIAEAIAGALTMPTALFVDDAHLLRGEGLRILAKLGTAVNAGPRVLVVGLRSEGLRTLRNMFADFVIEELALSGVRVEDLRSGVTTLIGRDDSRLAEVLYARTEGNPLFVASLLDAFKRKGRIRREGEGWSYVGEADDDVDFPDSLARYIELRLRARTEDAVSVACVLSLETAARAEDLADVLNAGEERILNALDELLTFGIIRQPANGPRFAFVHDLTREVASNLLNAGRRDRLHRGLARCLESRAEPDSSLRRARHLVAAGEYASAGHAYMQSATAALGWDAWHEAAERCTAGINALERLERTPDSDALLSALQRLASEAELECGDSEAAMDRAVAAIALGRRSGDRIATLRAMATREEALLAAIDLDGGLPAAKEFVDEARRFGDDTLLAIALHDSSLALRLSGQSRDAIDAGEEAFDLAQRCENWEIASKAAENLVRCGITWWHFVDAIKAANLGIQVARRAGPIATVGAYLCTAELAFARDSFDEAETSLREARQNLDRAASGQQRLVEGSRRHVPSLRLAMSVLAAEIALTAHRWDAAMLEADSMSTAPPQATRSIRDGLMTMLRVEALLGRNASGDVEHADELVTMLAPISDVQDTVTWSRCAYLTIAEVSARTGSATAGVALVRALDAVEANARRTPLDADRAFAKLETAARICGDREVERRAALRRDHYHARRIAAAGSAMRPLAATGSSRPNATDT